MTRLRSTGVLFLMLVAAACGGDEPATDPPPEPSSGPTDLPEPSAEFAKEGFLSEDNQRPVYLFFPSEDGESLLPEERIIFLTATQSSQVKQAVSELLLGPQTEGRIASFPVTTRLLAVFILPDGTAVLDLGAGATAIPAGTSAEHAAIYSLVNTVTYNFPGIERLQILVEGREISTLVGHLDTSRPLEADLASIDWSSLEGVDPDAGPPHYVPPGIGKEAVSPPAAPVTASGGGAG